MTLGQGSAGCGVHKVSLTKTVCRSLLCGGAAAKVGDKGAHHHAPIQNTVGLWMWNFQVGLLDPVTWHLRNGCATEFYANHKNAVWSTVSHLCGHCVVILILQSKGSKKRRKIDFSCNPRVEVEMETFFLGNSICTVFNKFLCLFIQNIPLLFFSIAPLFKKNMS